MPRQCGLIHLEAFHRIAAVAQRPEYEILHRVFGAAGRTEADQVLGEGDLLIKPPGDRGGDAITQMGIERHEGHPCCCYRCQRAASKPPNVAARLAPRMSERYPPSWTITVGRPNRATASPIRRKPSVVTLSAASGSCSEASRPSASTSAVGAKASMAFLARSNAAM